MAPRYSLPNEHEVINAEVDHDRNWTEVVYNPELADHYALIHAINLAGGGKPQKYQARLVI